MKNSNLLFISLLIISFITIGFLSIPETQNNVTLTPCQQYFCAKKLNGDPAPYVMIHVVRLTDTVEVGNCTTNSEGCCPSAMTLTVGTNYWAYSDCISYIDGEYFTACTQKPVTLTCSY